MLKIYQKQILFLLAILAFTVIIGCGKKTKESKSVEGPGEQLPQTASDRDAFLDKQQVACDQGQNCPNYISKMVVFDNQNIKYCTAFLVDRDKIATAASCLPAYLRQESVTCDKDVFFFFQGPANRPAIKIGCEKILQVSNLEGSDAGLWRSDVAFIKLTEKINGRRFLDFNRDGLGNHKEFTFWGIDQIDDSTGFIRRQECESIHNSYLNPLATSEFSPNMLFSGCGLRDGNSGAPIIDTRGRVRGMVSRSINRKTVEYLQTTGLLTKPLNEMFHATNFSCAPTIFDTNIADEKECSKDLSAGAREDLRSQVLSFSNILKEMKNKLEAKISDGSQYFNFAVKFNNVQVDEYKTEITPKCFKNISRWINTLNTSRNAYVFQASLPNVVVKRKMNSYGRIVGVDESLAATIYNFQFSPKLLSIAKTSLVFMWNDLVNLQFPNMTESCQ